MQLIRWKFELIIFSIVCTMCHGIEIRVPVNYTALTGDLEIHVQDLTPQEDPYYVQLLEYYPLDNSFTIIGSTMLVLDNATTLVYKAKFPCGVIAQGGRYGVRVQSDFNSDINEILVTVSDDIAVRNTSEPGKPRMEKMRDPIMQLNVRWPMVSLSIEPQEIETYPEVNVTASVMFQASYCEPSIGSLVPETWISLIYCGHSPSECKLDNVSHLSQILYSEQIRGYPRLRDISLRCQLFGQAGYYTLYLTSGMHATGSVVATIPIDGLLKTKWSEKFVFNVHTRSIFQCDAHNGGVAVLFQYPNCILPNDKIRLFGSLRADVASLLPPTTLHYITEHRVVKGKYSLHFDCELFSEKYVEYCFVYVNQAITGAVTDVRMDCVPTYPISEAGQWGSWSEWSECSSTCKGGTRNRYRFCDSPSPKYGAKYCEGHTVETEPCGNGTSWECQLYDVQVTPELLAEKPEIQEVVGEKCRCGCVIHLDASMPQRFLAASMRNCSKKAWWKIQADPDHTVQLYMNRVHFPCTTQKLKIHDGEFLSSNLLAQFTSTDVVTMTNFSVMSSGSVLLLEYAISENSNNAECTGGFVCHFRQKASMTLNISHIYAESMSGEMPVEAVHVAILVMLIIVVTMSLCMTIQYVDRYHKYQRAAVSDDVTDTECSETFSRRNFAAVISHETSTSTLISEIIPLRKLCRENKALQTNDYEPEFENSSQSDNDEDVKVKICSEAINLKENAQQSSKICVFKAEIHAESKPDESSGSINSASIDEPSSDPISGLNTSRTNISERRPSACTRISVSSSISPTLSSHTNAISSPNSSLRGSTLKRVKDIKNQEKMMIGSDFSLTGQDTDLEMDYYDYNVQNTSAVPGSYLGMDPAYCVWIPPFAPGQWIDNGSDDDDSSSTTNDIEMKVISRRCSRKISETSDSDRSETPTEKFQRECKIHSKEKIKRFSGLSTTSSSNRTVVPDDMTPDDDLTIQEALKPDSPKKVQQALVIKDGELEGKALLEKDDIKFVDDDEDSDTAYNSEDDEMKKLKKSANRRIKSVALNGS